MRTRKHQSPVYSDGIASAICEEQGVFKVTSPVGRREREAANGVNQYDSGENYSNVDQKKINGKRQKRRKRSPRNKGLVPTVDCTLAGLMADHVWLEKTMYEEAESAYYTKLAEDQRKAVEAKSLAAVPVCNTHTVSEEAVKNIKPTIVNCCHGSMTACHHVDNGIWVNKFSFDEAESQFVMKFVSPLATHALGLPLVPHGGDSHHCTQRTPDEGYVSATSTPAAQRLLDVGAESSLVSADPTVNGKPHWAGLQDLVSEVWIDKHSYDHAERCFYETVAVRQSELKTEPHQPWSLHSGKKGKRDKWNRKSTGKQLASKKRDLPSIPEENGGLLHRPVYYFLHRDSENVWLDKSMYDKAEARYYASQEQIINQMVNMKKSPIAKLPKPAKPKHRAAPCHKKRMAAPLLSTEKVWLDKYKYDDAERQYYEQLSFQSAPNSNNPQQEDGASTILRDIARARENIQKSLAGSAGAAPANSGDNSELLSRVANLERENQSLHKVVKDLQSAISKLENRLSTLEKSVTSQPSAPAPACTAAAPVQKVQVTPAAAAAPKEEEEDDDDDIDLFGSDEEEEDSEAAKVREERLRQYAEKKSKKPGVIAKSSILLDVKPWDDETDMAKMEECVRSVQMDGLLWGSSKLVPVGYGIKKLQIQCVVEDDKVGTDILEEEITKFEDYVQSVDIAAFNKI